MAFCVGIKVPKWFTTLLVLVHCFKFLLIVALSHLGLLRPSQEMTELEEYRRRQTDNQFVVLDRLCPSAVPVPIHVLTEYIKRKLPVVEFGQVFEKYTRHESPETECSVCLECIERSHEVREPCNCDHVFHRECLDSWVNQGQVTCPFCRSLLFPAKSEITSCGGGSSGKTERDDAYFNSICLECIERIHEVREHCNCDHVFHIECLNGWVNQGQVGRVTCPLCGALLFPAKSETTSCSGRNSGTMEGDPYIHTLEFIVG